MKVSITGEADFIRGFSEGEEYPLEVESVSLLKEQDEQQFGLVEIGIIVAIVKGVYDLSEIIARHWRERGSPKKQTLRVKTALGVVTLELDENVDPETLCRWLAPLFAE